jgi:large subunit ribosomal protein L17
MRHRRSTKKLGRTQEHRKALLAALVCAFIREQRIRTTLSKARLARSFAEKLVTTAKDSSLGARRRALAALRSREAVTKLFGVIAPQYADRKGGYTRIVKLGTRGGDGSTLAYLEWVNLAPVDRRRKPAKEEKAGKADEADAAKDAPKKE